MAGVGDCKEGAFRHAVGSDDVVTIVRKVLARFEARELADDTVSLHHEAFPGGFGDDPFPRFDGDGGVGFVRDGDEVDEGIGPIGGRIEMRHVNHAIDFHSQPFKFRNHTR